MTQDNHDTLIERLEGEIDAWRLEYEAIKHLPNTVFETPLVLLLQEAISRLKQSQWTPIEDIPEEWKDGRNIHLFIKSNSAVMGGDYTFPLYDCQFIEESQEWFDDNGEIIDTFSDRKITHAMLPPQAPKG